MSEDYLIRARGVTKTYRLHKRPAARLASLFAREKPDQQLAPGEVYHALRGIDVEIKRGEKVAIIGRNGAGKSTLLKIITGVIKPTTGTIDVRGKSHALLSLGAGFHPDFTGRENAQAFLAHMGVSGRRADELVEDAIAFAEIEEHIDQPLKTYSTGMQARLMFAVSTALNPELLVIDEVLGVGDAYFQNKSFERIREMCGSGDTTLLIVSHDIYSAAKLVDRVVWIDKGRVMGDGSPADTIKAYENSIRIQEDSRQKQKLALDFRRSAQGRKTMLPAFIEIRARGNAPAASPVFFASAGLQFADGTQAQFPILALDGRPSAMVRDITSQLLPHLPWGEPGEIDGVTVRPWNNFGAVDHKAGFAIFPHSESASTDLDTATLKLRLRADGVVDADIVFIRPDGSERILHRLLTVASEWQELAISFQSGNETIGGSALAPSGDDAALQLGTGGVVATQVKMQTADFDSTFIVEHGSAINFALDLLVNDTSLNEPCQIVLAFKRNGIEDVARVFGKAVQIDGGGSKHVRVLASVPSFKLGVGRYSLTVLIARKGYYEEHTGQFFAINPNVLYAKRDEIEFEVVDRTSLISSGTGYVVDADWTLLGENQP
jgi:lipopolysaccharide transport system ATP-binding protein